MTAPAAAAPTWPTRRARRARRALLALAAVALAVTVAALAMGATPVSVPQVLTVLAARFGLVLGPVTPLEDSVVLALRLPRALLGLSVGAALGVGGALLQGLFRNPLADPGLIGASSGAALGAALLIVLGPPLLGAAELPVWALPVGAFAGALAALLVAWRLATRRGLLSVGTLLLAGVAVAALTSAGTGLLATVADDAQLRTLTFWTLGSLNGATWPAVAAAGVPALALVLAIPRLARPLNAMLLGDGEARCLGVDVERVKRVALVLTALAVGAAVSVSGIIGFVGLVAPHLVRLALGPDHRVVLPGAALLGGALLVGADLVARTVVAPSELPIGIVTTLVGAPFFLGLLARDRRVTP